MFSDVDVADAQSFAGGEAVDDTWPDLEHALAQLPADQREAIVLRYADELSYEEMARVTGRSVGAQDARATGVRAGFLVGPAVAVAVLARRPRTLLRWRLLLAGAMALIVGLSPFAVEPIRAAWHPVLNEGEPTGCAQRIGMSCTFSRTTVTRLMANVYPPPCRSDRYSPLRMRSSMPFLNGWMSARPSCFAQGRCALSWIRADSSSGCRRVGT